MARLPIIAATVAATIAVSAAVGYATMWVAVRQWDRIDDQQAYR